MPSVHSNGNVTMRVIPIRNPAPVLSVNQVRFRLFYRAATMSLLQSAGIVALAHQSLWALVTSFAISFWWISATRDSVDYRVPWGRVSYGAGGAAGVGVVLAVTWLAG